MHIIVFFVNNNCNADVCDVWASPAYNDVMISRQSFTLICSHCGCSIFVSVCVEKTKIWISLKANKLTNHINDTFILAFFSEWLWERKKDSLCFRVLINQIKMWHFANQQNYLKRENKTGKQEEKPIASHIELYIKRWATL